MRWEWSVLLLLYSEWNWWVTEICAPDRRRSACLVYAGIITPRNERWLMMVSYFSCYALAPSKYTVLLNEWTNDSVMAPPNRPPNVWWVVGGWGWAWLRYVKTIIERDRQWWVAWLVCFYLQIIIKSPTIKWSCNDDGRRMELSSSSNKKDGKED